MATNEKVTEILNLMNDYPELPVLPMVGGEIVADDSYAYWTASWGYAEIKKLCVYDERVIFLDEDYLWETAEELNLDYDVLGLTDEIPDDEATKKLREILDSLDWLEAIVVYINTPDGDIPDNTAKINRIYEEAIGWMRRDIKTLRRIRQSETYLGSRRKYRILLRLSGRLLGSTGIE